ncbi:hypothetical protein [Krasilnikovia sp. MM14-A1259]|uniref:hypothetical protein n=1 Tax=Krasilnikovia sp. MM14-A1259 TaxID=3373539 RepID=UPI0037F125BA
MAFRTWARLLPVTLGVAALAGASQLGLAYGLGIVQLNQTLDVTARDRWTAQLAWVAWFAMNAAVVGAITGVRAYTRAAVQGASGPGGADASSGDGPAADVRSAGPPGPGAVIALALTAGLGAAIVIALTMQPARAARVSGVDPVVVIGICGGLGAVAGVIMACLALTWAVARWNLAAAGAAVWVVALVSVAPALAPGRSLPAVRLGVFEPSWLPVHLTPRAALVTMPALALLVGVAVGWAARRAGRDTLAISLAGLSGPALLTVAYLIAGPGTGAAQSAPYWAAMTAAGAGVLGSVLTAVLRRGPLEDEDDREPATERPEADADPADGGDPTPEASVPAARRSEEQRPADPGPTAAGNAARPGGRRSNFADAFRPRPRRPEPAADPEPAPFDGFASGAAPRHGAPEGGDGPRGRQQRTGSGRGKDNEYVDWVSGLGTD